jgi:peptidyl-prolyl cis-trans isomerase SurA
LLLDALCRPDVADRRICAAAIEIDRVVAVVNNAVITEYELQSRVARAVAQLAGQKTAQPPRRLLEKQLLERMITEKALMQVAEDSNIRS